MALSTHSLTAGLARVAARMETAADELNGLDAKIGDGDLGVTLVRLGRALTEGMGDLPDDVGMALMRCVQAITKVSGSSYATLVATALLSAAKTCRGRTEVPLSEMPALLAGAADAMKARGKAELGDKTVVDAVDAAAKATAGLGDGVAILAAAGTAVDGVLTRLRDQPSRTGRARIWAEKSVGLDDPGMVAFRRMIDGLAAPTREG